MRGAAPVRLPSHVRLLEYPSTPPWRPIPVRPVDSGPDGARYRLRPGCYVLSRYEPDGAEVREILRVAGDGRAAVDESVRARRHGVGWTLTWFGRNMNLMEAARFLAVRRGPRVGRSDVVDEFLAYAVRVLSDPAEEALARLEMLGE